MNWKIILRVVVLASTSILFISCAHIKPEQRGSGVLDTKGQGGILNGGAVAESPRSTKDDQPLGDEIAGVKLEVTKFDIPVAKNPRVEFWVKYFTGRGRDVFAQYIERLGKMSPLIVPRLKAAGLPEDLIYLAMIESGFSHSARSPMGAVGPWQFMRSTGRLFGLRADWWVDERRDPMKSTDAAIRYLSRLNDEFKDWQLSAAAYNAGEGRIRKGIARYDTRDYWELARRRAIRPETVDYVPKMMAAAIITKNAHAFGFNVPEYDAVWNETKLVTLSYPEDIYTVAKFAGVHPNVIRYLNPELMHQTTPPLKGYQIRVQNQKAVESITAALESGELGKYRGFKTYAVRRGDTLSRVASRFGVQTAPIIALNSLSNARRLRPGQVLILPLSRDGEYVVRNASAPRRVPAVTVAKAPHVLYTVKAGDTLYAISRRYDVSIQQLKRWNALHSYKNLRPGRQLRLYVRNDQPNT